ncbi:hypothetical protein ACJIZ3_011692 [Penstemon smallii]|uniref:Homeobox domain-containing protein n=1 Tax=Penstemon smallii TaxID=265156 RepID=A0ABD3UL93_9LAMI
MRSSKEEASASRVIRSRDEPAFDIISAVKRLHELNAQQLSKLISDSGSNVIRHTAEDGSHIQIDVEKFARHLPCHFIAVIMSWERDKSTFKYLLCGILLLHAMCDLAARVPKIEQILLDDVKVSEQLIDMVFYLLIVLGTYRQENQHTPNDMILLHSALVACSLKLLTVVISPNFQEVAQVLTSYYKVDIFMDAAFGAVCIDVKVLQDKLSAGPAEASANTSPSHGETLIHLYQQCDCSLQFLQALCQQKLFRERIVKNKELCGNGGVLVMVRAVMNLKLSPLQSSMHITFVSRLKCKALSILLLLCEAESVSYLDEVTSNERSQKLAKSIALKVLDLLKKMFGIDSITSPSEIIVNLKGQLGLNAMRLADIFSDDSNFRSFIMIRFTKALAAIFVLPHGEFLSGWCSSDHPNCEDDASLDVPWESYAHHITSLLIKVIANLHCFVPDVCQDEKDLFLSKFVRCLQKKSQSLTDGFSSTFDTEKTKNVSKNLCSLLSHAESLVPRFLNEDDVQLLRLFISQFESQIVHAASGEHIVQTEIAANHNSGVIDIEECLPENVAFQEVIQLDDSRNGNEQSIDVEQRCGVMEPIGASRNLRETSRDARIVETSGSDSSPTRRKNDRMDIDHVRGSGFEETQEDEKVDAMHSDEKQQRKRKRTVMNDKQIGLIESALVDEPDMHRNSTSLRLWAEELSRHGAEVTTSRLKNWLNNRKARLARVAKDVRVSHEGDNLDRQGGSGQFDSPQSPMDIPFTGRGSNRNEVKDTTSRDSVDEDSGASLSTPMGGILRPGIHFEPGQFVMLVGEKAEEIGKGKIFQVCGKWCGRSLEQSGICVVDIYELSIDRFANLLYPTEVTGNSFDQAEKRLGLMRVLWDLNKVFMLPPPP